MGKRRSSSSSSRRVNQRSNRRSTRVKRGKGSRIKRNSRKKGSLRPKRTKRIRRRNKIQVGGPTLSPSGKAEQEIKAMRTYAPRGSQNDRLRIRADAQMEKRWLQERLRRAEEEEEMLQERRRRAEEEEEEEKEMLSQDDPPTDTPSDFQKKRDAYAAAEKATKEKEITEMITEFYRLKNLHTGWGFGSRMASWTSGDTKAMDDIIDTLAENCLPSRDPSLPAAMRRGGSAAAAGLPPPAWTDAGKSARGEYVPSRHQIPSKKSTYRPPTTRVIARRAQDRAEERRTRAAVEATAASVSQMCQFMLNEFIEKELQDVLTTNIADNWDKLKDLPHEHPDFNVDTSPEARRKALQSVIDIFNKRGKDLSGTGAVSQD